ncbi:MAG: HlyD family efflux transporter periplasmic adaptor subunit [Polyangiales bacterium]
MSAPAAVYQDDSEAASKTPYLIALLLVVAVGYALYALTRPPEPVMPELLTVTRGEAVYRTESAGRIVPLEEVFVRSQVAGQLVEMKVRPGDQVEKGQHIATIRVIADPVILGEARAQVRVADARLETAVRELTRLRQMKSGMGLSVQESAKAEDNERLARTEAEAARERQRLIAEGVASSNGGRSTRVTASITGTVLATPVAVGDFVGDMNAYRDGSTIAVLADMNRLVFKGHVEEAHVGSLRVGMPAVVTVGALPGTKMPGKLTWVSPRATVEQGASSASSNGGGGGASQSSGTQIMPLTASTTGVTKFELWVELDQPPAGMRAGYTGAAELTLDRRQNVPVIHERALRFENGKVFAKVWRKDRPAEDREVVIGVSDGITIELVSGLDVGEQVAVLSTKVASPWD